MRARVDSRRCGLIDSPTLARATAARDSSTMSQAKVRRKVGQLGRYRLDKYQTIFAAAITAVGGVVVAIVTIIGGEAGDSPAPPTAPPPISSTSPANTVASPAVAIRTFQEGPVAPPPARLYSFTGTSHAPASWRVAVVGRSPSGGSDPIGPDTWIVSSLANVDQRGDWKILLRLVAPPSKAVQWIAVAVSMECSTCTSETGPGSQAQESQVQNELRRMGPGAPRVQAVAPVTGGGSVAGTGGFEVGERLALHGGLIRQIAPPW